MNSNKRVRRLLVVAAAISAFGDGLSTEAAGFLIDATTSSALQLSLGQFGASVGKIAVGLLLGPKLTKQNALGHARIGSVLAILPTLAWCVVGGNVPAMLGLQIARSSLGAVVNISLLTVLPRSGNGAETLRNFAVLQFAVGAVEGVGGFVSPFLTQHFGAWVFVADAISFGCFYLRVAFVRPRDIADDGTSSKKTKTLKPALEFSDALRYVVSHRKLFSVVIAFAAIYVCWAVNSAVGYPILREWGLPREYRSYFKLAATLGGLFATWRMLCPTGEDAPSCGLPSPLALGSTIALLGAVTIMTGFVQSGILGILLQFPQGFVSDAASVMVKAFIAHECGPQMVGPVNGLAYALNMTVLSFGRLLAGAIAEAYSARAALVIGGMSTLALLWVAAKVDAAPKPPRPVRRS